MLKPLFVSFLLAFVITSCADTNQPKPSAPPSPPQVEPEKAKDKAALSHPGEASKFDVESYFLKASFDKTTQTMKADLEIALKTVDSIETIELNSKVKQVQSVEWLTSSSRIAAPLTF